MKTTYDILTTYTINGVKRSRYILHTASSITDAVNVGYKSVEGDKVKVHSVKVKAI